MTPYDLLYLSALPLATPLFVYKYLIKGKYHESLPSMSGRRLPAPPTGAKDASALRIWIHAVSVGETVAAKSIILPLRDALPQARFFVSTVTETGQATARRILSDLVEDIFFYPLDLSWNVDRFLDAYRPDVFIMMETELWPNMLTRAARRGVRLFTLNGRLSDRSFPWYRRFRFLFRGPLSNIKACAVQSPIDAERMRHLCGPGAKIEVTGNCKFDLPAEPLTEEEQQEFRQKYRLTPDRDIIVAGSTHPGEEDIVMAAWEQVQARYPQTTLILAPRHPERFNEVANALRGPNRRVSRASAPSLDDPDVLVLDEMGVLAQIYGIARVGVVCGSYAPIGGHNLLEPAAHGIPVVYGPYMNKQKELLRIVNAAHGGIQVNGSDLGATLIDLLSNDKRRETLGRAAREAVEANRGSAKRSIEFILPYFLG